MTLASIIRNLTRTAMAIAAFTTVSIPAMAQMNVNSPERIEFVVDVAEDMDLFVEPRIPVGTEPLRGSFFVTEGKIFPYGTIPATNGSEFNPKTVSGAIGAWYCKGTFLVKGSVFDKTSAAVLTDQMFFFQDGKQSIATTGTEGAGITVRPVIGGTGYYAGYTGEQTQEFLGFNKTGGVNLRVTVKLRKVTNFR